MHTNTVMVMEIVTISAGTRPPNTLPMITAFESLVGDDGDGGDGDDDDGDGDGGDGDGDVGGSTNGEEERYRFIKPYSNISCWYLTHDFILLPTFFHTFVFTPDSSL